MEAGITTEEELKAALADISFAPSCVDMGWQWETEPVYDFNGENSGHDPSVIGWFVNTSFQRPDTSSGAVGRGRGRKEFVPVGTSVSGAVKTAWLLAELIVLHELREAFLYKGNRVFDPHKTVDELCVPAACRA